MAHPSRAILFLAWGDSYIREALRCISESTLPAYDTFLITDQASDVPSGHLTVIRGAFKTNGRLRKTELIDFLPPGYKSFLFLDSDTRVLSDIDSGFSKAEAHGIAAAPAPHYSLDHFWGFGKIMEAEGVSRSGQLQYNTGVIFFSLTEETRRIFRLWKELGTKYAHTAFSDQPFFTLAMEKNNFSPYTLSPGYNYRGFGDSISGIVRIWHSHRAMPENINQFEFAWPPRRVINGRVVYPERARRSLVLRKLRYFMLGLKRRMCGSD